MIGRIHKVMSGFGVQVHFRNKGLMLKSDTKKLCI